MTESTELVIFLILTFGGCTIQNSWASPLVAATCTIQELMCIEYTHRP